MDRTSRGTVHDRPGGDKSELRAVFAALQLVTEYDTSSTIRRFVDQLDWYLVGHRVWLN